MTPRLIPDSARSTQHRQVKRLAGERVPVAVDMGLKAKRALLILGLIARKER